MLPTSAKVTQEFGNNFIYNGKWAYGPAGHNGMDFGASTGSVVVAPANLTILSYGDDPSGYGRLMKGRDAYGYTHWFAHLLSPLVGAGTQVLAGQPIAVTDNTGFSTAPHLHWGVQLPGYGGYNGYVNPRNWPGFAQTTNMPTQQQFNDVKAERDTYAEAWAAEKYFHMRGPKGSTRAENRLRMDMPWSQANAEIDASAEWQANQKNPWWGTSWAAAKQKIIDFINSL